MQTTTQQSDIDVEGKRHSPVVLLMGPTAAGKTDLALTLVEEFPFEIVSVDSAMIYRGLDVGSGKPSREILAQVPHHLVDILDPSERYSAGQFVRDAHRLIREIQSRGRVPLLVGGTMLYFRALTQGMAELPEANPSVRADIESEARKLGWPALHAELAMIDPPAAKKILPNDGQRIQRALEVFRLTGRPLSVLHREAVGQTPTYNYIPLVWNPSRREVLYERIAARFTRMMKTGFLDEVTRLYARKDLSRELPSMRTVGYRQLLDYCCGNSSLVEAVDLGIVATRHLARRQLVWLRAGRNYEWFDALEPSALAHIKERIAAHLQVD
jgi:tRNA dimethylallyltransferase